MNIDQVHGLFNLAVILLAVGDWVWHHVTEIRKKI